MAWYRDDPSLPRMQRGKPTAVLLSISDFDDMLEEVDPEFKRSLTAAAREHRSGKAVTSREYLKQRLLGRRAG